MRCIILEDEIPAQKILESYISKIPNVELVDKFQTCSEANLFFKTNEIDVVFLDINLPDISGIDFIKTVKNPPKIIMTTAYPEFALDSFELDTITDYLVKPFSFDRFLKAIRKAENKYQGITKENTESIFVNVDKTLHKVLVDNILYVESDRNYVTIVTSERKLVFIDSLKKWSNKLPSNFVQIHKSYIINIKKVEKLAGNEVFIKGKRFPVGRTFKTDLLHKIATV